MTSRIVSFFKLFNRGNVAATSAGPNSWATVGIWRRFFELKEQEEQEQNEGIVEILEEIYDIPSSNDIAPIESETAVQARRQMISEYYMGLRNGNGNANGNSNGNGSGNRFGIIGNNGNSNVNVNARSTNDASNWRRDDREHNPNLDIPVGDFHMTLPQ